MNVNKSYIQFPHLSVRACKSNLKIQSMKTNPILTSLVVFAILSGGAVFTSGCKPTSVDRTATERSADVNVAETVKTALSNSTSYKFPDVQVASFNGKVQLSGFVTSDDQREAAEAMTKALPGVASVENKISVKK